MRLLLIKKLIYPLLTIGSIVALCSCSASRASLQTFNHTIQQGEYQSLKNISVGNIGSRNTPKDLLWNLQAGASERLLKEYKSSNIYFDQAEQAFSHFDQQLLLKKSAQSSTSIFFNDSAFPYIGKIQDRIMVNAYKAINYATLGDFKGARVEFNRALQRQNEAKSFFDTQIYHLKNQLSQDKEKLTTGQDTINATLNNPHLVSAIDSKYKNLESFDLYSDFVNPFATYMAGLFFWLEGDTPKAIDLLKEAYAMNTKQNTVRNDFNRAVQKETPKNEMWIVFENGLAAQRKEIRIDIPVVSNQLSVKYIGTSFPNLIPGQNAYSYLTILTNSSTIITTEPFVSMDNLIATEFKKELPGIITREVSRVAIKTYLQYEMQNNYGDLGGLLSGLYQAATTATDVRSWSLLPKNFQLAHLEIPNNRQITVQLPTNESFIVNVPRESNNVILYIRLVAPNVEPVYDFIIF